MSARESAGGGVLAIGPLPPPIHGYSLITARVIEQLQRVASVEVLDISPGTILRGWRYHFVRAKRALRAAWRVLRQKARRRTLYLAIAGGAGVFYDLGFVLAARLRGYRMVIHHNAFSYLNERSVWVAALIVMAGRDAVHICLCPHMARRLGEQYPLAVRRLVLSNAALVPVSRVMPRSSPRRGIRLGFLGNLIPEKGLDTAIAVATALGERRDLATLIVAGPVVDRSALRLLDEAKKRLAEAFDYRGAVHGDAKAAFFADIDVLLFPTRYANEAQPLVLFEALAHGIPVIAAARGCIGEDMVGAGIAVPPDGDFVAIAVKTVSDWLAEPARFAAASAAAHQQVRRSHEIATSGLAEAIEVIAGGPSETGGIGP